ncbi:MAG: hypothetical protein FWC51_02320 [Proteobacteria bacterium]|nr:hypothetical protein [Pseudomonadota bacterium]
MSTLKKQLYAVHHLVLRVFAAAVFCMGIIGGAAAHPHNDWDDFEDCHACYNEMKMFCQNYKPATNAVLNCLNGHYGYLSRKCWKDLDFFAKKFPDSRWSIFNGKLK